MSYDEAMKAKAAAGADISDTTRSPEGAGGRAKY